MKLADVLNSADQFLEKSLFLPKGKKWSLQSPALVWDCDDIDDDEQEVPRIVEKYNMEQVLDVADIEDIVLNAKEQRPDCSINDLFDAFMYYVANDAFIDFTSRENGE